MTRPALPLVVIAGIAEVVGFALFAGGSRHGVAVAAVLASQFAAIAAVAAYFLFRERLTRVQLVGVGGDRVWRRGSDCFTGLIGATSGHREQQRQARQRRPPLHGGMRAGRSTETFGAFVGHGQTPTTPDFALRLSG